METIHEICPMCGTECRVVVTPVQSVTWGNDEYPTTYNGVKYGSFTFDIYDDEHYECSNAECMAKYDGFYTFEQCKSHSIKVSEWIKTNLGFDWLAENEKRRAINKAKRLEKRND